MRKPASETTIAVVGKYAKHRDAYKSIYESLIHAGVANDARVLIRAIESEEIEQEGVEQLLAGADGILVPGGFGKRGIEGKIATIRYARERNIPFFGICLGMQCATIEFARNVLKLPKAHSTEFDESTPDPVICLMPDQTKVTDKGATMRLGASNCDLKEGSLARRAYGADRISERHRHRYEFNNDYYARFEDAGLIPSGKLTNGKLVEIVELENHPWFLAVQFHPEFKSKLTAPHPLFRSFVEAAVRRRAERARG
jgi:CTP synthase